jgi:tetratricopeptide (TPR) repeat protein
MARKRLNTNLLIILAVVVALGGLGLFLAGRAYRDNPERAVNRAMEFEEAGQWQKAADQWGKAYRATQIAEYGLKVVDNVAKLTADEEDGGEKLQQMSQILEQVVGDDTSNVEAMRRLLRFHADNPTFRAGQPSRAALQIRDVANKILALEPDDPEALVFRAAATVDLSSVTSEEITEEDIEQARAEAAAVVANDPVDGTGLRAMRTAVGLQMSRPGVTREDQQATFDQFVADVEAAAAALEDGHEPRDGFPTDTASAYTHLGQAFETIAFLANNLAQFDVARAARDANEEPDAVTARNAGDEAAESYRDKAVQYLRRAIEEVDAERDTFETIYADVHYNLAETLRRRNAADPEIEALLEKMYDERPWSVRAARIYADQLRERNQHAQASQVMRAASERAEEPLPQVPGFAGLQARENKAQIGLFLADSLLEERRAERRRGDATAASQRTLLADAEEALAAYEEQAALLSLPKTFAVRRVEGQLQVAAGETFAGLETLERALRELEQNDSAAARRERVDMLRLLADINRESGQAGAETEYLQRAFNLAGTVADGLRLAELYRLSGDKQRAMDVLDRLDRVKDALPEATQQSLQRIRIALTGQLENLPEGTREEKISKIQVAFAASDMDLAARLADELLEEFPEDEQIGLIAAQVASSRGDRDGAITILQGLPDSETAKLALERLAGNRTVGLDENTSTIVQAQLAQQQGDTARAIELVEGLVDGYDDSTRTAERNRADELLFGLYLQAKRLDDARVVADRLGSRGADGAGGEIYRIRLTMAEGDLESALELATRTADAYPSMAEAQRLLSETLRLSGEPGEAAEAAEQALRLAPTDLRVVIEAATAFEQAGRIEESKAAIERGLAQRRNDPRLLAALDALELGYGDAAPVLAKRRERAEADPDNLALRQQLLEGYVAAIANARRKGETDRVTALAAEGVAEAAEAVAFAEEPGNLVRFLANLGVAAGGEARQTVRTFFDERMTPTHPETLIADASAVAAAATFYANDDNITGAEQVVRRHLNTIPADAPRTRQASMRLALSQLLSQQGQTRDAIDVLSGFEDLPTVSNRIVSLLAARATGATGEEKERLYDELAQAMKGDDISSTAYSAATLAELRRGNAQAALDYANEGLESLGHNADLLYLRAVARGQIEDGDLQEAVDDFERSIELRPSNLDAYRNLARVYQELGERDEAENALRRLLDIRAGDVQARLSLAQMRLAVSPPDFEAADRYFRGADGTEAADSPILLLARARMEALRNRGNDAINYGRRALEQSVEVQRGFAESGVAPQGADTLAANVPSYLNGYLDLLLQFGRADEALRQVEFWGQRLGGDANQLPWWLARRQAEALAASGRDRAAREAYANAYQLTLAARGQQGAAQVLLEMEKDVGIDAAYALIEDQVEADPIDVPATYAATRLFAQAGNYDRAIELLQNVRQALDAGNGMSPQQEAAFQQQLGTLYLSSQPPRLEESINAFRRARELSPDSIGVNNNLAYTLTLLADREGTSDEARRRYLSEAVERSQQAVDLDTERQRPSGNEPTPSVIDTLGWSKAQLAILDGNEDELQEAIRLLQRARTIAERDDALFPEVFRHLAVALEATGDLEAALENTEVGIEFLLRRLEDRETRRPGDEELLSELRAAAQRLKDQIDAADAETEG